MFPTYSVWRPCIRGHLSNYKKSLLRTVWICIFQFWELSMTQRGMCPFLFVECSIPWASELKSNDRFHRNFNFGVGCHVWPQQRTWRLYTCFLLLKWRFQSMFFELLDIWRWRLNFYSKGNPLCYVNDCALVQHQMHKSCARLGNVKYLEPSLYSAVSICHLIVVQRLSLKRETLYLCF